MDISVWNLFQSVNLAARPPQRMLFAIDGTELSISCRWKGTSGRWNSQGDLTRVCLGYNLVSIGA